MAEAGDLGGGELLGHHGPDQVELEAERVPGAKPGGQLVHLHVGRSQPGGRGVLIIFLRILIRMCDAILLAGGLRQYGVKLCGHRRGLCARGPVRLAVESQQF